MSLRRATNRSKLATDSINSIDSFNLFNPMVAALRRPAIARLMLAAAALSFFSAPLVALEQPVVAPTNPPPQRTAATPAKPQLTAADRLKAEQHVFDLARQLRHAEVVSTVNELEKQGELSWGMHMQRLYALVALGQKTIALELADKLAPTHSNATDLGLLRADLLRQAGRRLEANALLQQIARQNPGAPAGLEAAKRFNADEIYELARQEKHREALAAIDELEGQTELSWELQMQRLYALQILGQTSRAIELAQRLAVSHADSTELALMRADLLIRERRWEEASRVLKQIKRDQPGTPVAAEANRRLAALPPVANLDKWQWGEAYVSGEYLGRFGSVVGSGFIRQGAYLPEARWLQPYAELRFTVDTRSGVGAQRTIIADNFVAVSLGARVQPFPTEYFFLYISGGYNKDLLGRRNNGDWAADFQAGLYGFKSWGPGTVLRSIATQELVPTTGNVPPPAPAASTVPANARAPERFLWRGDWFADAGADFSYYDRFASWIGYGQAHQGFRLVQLGPKAALDAYAVENISWDVRGNYFDNLVEIGPGARLLWAPRRGWEIVLRAEWLNGFYLGRDDRHTRDGAAGQYDDFRVGLSLGARW